MMNRQRLTEEAGTPGPPLDWERICHAFPDGLIVTDRHFNIQYINATFGRISGKTADQVVGRKCHRVFACPLCHSAGCPLCRIRQGDGPLLYESDGHCKVTETPWQVAASAYFDANGSFAGMVEKVTDSSTLRKLRDQLYHSRER